jgi:hypothetical protein
LAFLENTRAAMEKAWLRSAPPVHPEGGSRPILSTMSTSRPYDCAASKAGAFAYLGFHPGGQLNLSSAAAHAELTILQTDGGFRHRIQRETRDGHWSRKSFNFWPLSNSLSVRNTLTHAFEGQGLFERRAPLQKSGRSIGALFWCFRYSTFSYSTVAKTSIALHSSRRTQDRCVIFGIDSSDHQPNSGTERSLVSKDFQHGSCLDPQRIGRRNSSRVFDRR